MSNDNPTVEGTVSALKGGVTSLPLGAALANIEGWQTKLEASDDPAVQALSAQLGELSAALQTQPIDPAEVGRLMTSLGEGTSGVAGGDSQLEGLGTLLKQAGSAL